LNGFNLSGNLEVAMVMIVIYVLIFICNVLIFICNLLLYAMFIFFLCIVLLKTVVGFNETIALFC
jgi:hypothetical protein